MPIYQLHPLHHNSPFTPLQNQRECSSQGRLRNFALTTRLNSAVAVAVAVAVIVSVRDELGFLCRMT